MASSGVLARVGLVSAVAVILGISTLSPLVKPASDFGRPVVSGPPLYQTASVPLPAPTEPGASVEARQRPGKLTSPATALLDLPPAPVAERPAAQPASAQRLGPATTAVAATPASQPQQQGVAAGDELPPAPIVAESEAQPKPEKRAAAPKRPKKHRTQPPIYTRALQMSVY
jgi:hypothetical protein